MIASIFVRTYTNFSSVQSIGQAKPFQSSTRSIRAARPLQVVSALSLSFEVPECPLEFGQVLKVVGSAPLGDWDVFHGLTLAWHEGHVWKGSIELPQGSSLEFKLVRAAGDLSIWEEGPNRVADIPGDAVNGSAHVSCRWNNPAETALDLALETAAPATPATPVETVSEAPIIEKEEVDMSWIDVPASFAESVAAATLSVVESEVPVVVAGAVAVTETEEVVEEVKEEVMPGKNGASRDSVLSEELTQFVEAVSTSQGGEVMTFTFNDSGASAAELAAKLLKRE